MMNERHAAILQALVAEYIRSGKPVGSEFLTSALSFAVSPATVRIVLRELEDDGFIEQPHTSAGRVPTDLGYRHYVNGLVARDIGQRQKEKIADQFETLQETYGRPARATAKLLAHLTSCLVISGWMRAHDIQEAGLAEILQLEDEDQKQALQEISFLLEKVDEYLRKLSLTKESNRETAVYIGSENPLFDAVHTTSMVRTVQLPTGEEVVLLMIGPKRMPYRRNVALLNSVASLLS